MRVGLLIGQWQTGSGTLAEHSISGRQNELLKRGAAKQCVTPTPQSEAPQSLTQIQSLQINTQ